jgi:hypothetical protein
LRIHAKRELIRCQEELERSEFNPVSIKKNNNVLPDTGRNKWNDELPTAARLMAGVSISCIFCDKPLESSDCFRAKSMTTEERIKAAERNKSCQRCLKKSH